MKSISKKTHLYVTCRPGVQGGEPVLRGTRIPVRSVVQYVILQGIPPESVAKEFRLTLAAVYDALSFYYDNLAAMNRLIQSQTEKAA